MNLKYIKTNIYVFIITFLLLSLIIFTISYRFLMIEFYSLEEEQNQKNITTYLSSIQKQLKTIHNIANDYSLWDDTYFYIAGSNPSYIYENFRDDISTLEDLDLDGVIFSTIKSKLLYAQFLENIFQNKSQHLYEKLEQSFATYDEIQTLWNYENNIFYVVKTKVLQSDKTGTLKGYMYSFKQLSKEHIYDINTTFNDIKIVFDKKSSYKREQALSQYLKVTTQQVQNNAILYNQLNFYNHEGYVFSLGATSSRSIINRGEKNIYVFNALINVLLLIIFYILYRNQRFVELHNKKLDLKVKKRTRQVEKAFMRLKIKNKELYDLANKDSLTQIHNRRSYFVQSEKVLKQAILQNKPLHILMMDIDHFKSINDNYGHAAGDKILIEFCNVVKNIIDDKAIFGRLGGEEFCITFYDITFEAVETISEKIRIECESLMIKIEEHEIQFTVSLGLSSRLNYDNIDKILQQSDTLLYQAKTLGRNRLIRHRRN